MTVLARLRPSRRIRGSGMALLAMALSGSAGMITFAVYSSAASGQTKVADPVAAASKPASTASQGSAPALTSTDLQPVQHAHTAGVRDCLASVDAAAKASISGTYTAVSTWDRAAPNDRLFNSIAGQTVANTISPQAVSILVADPAAPHLCDTTAVEIHPSALSCEEVERPLVGDKRQIKTSLGGVEMLQADPSLRFLLMPSPKGGCTVVSVRTVYGK